MMSTSAAKGLLKAAGTSARKLDRAMSKGRNIDPKTFTCPVELRFDQRQDTVATENVGAMVVGAKHPDEVVILTAHYDHLGVLEGQIHPGADDDGSGTATLMAMAKVLGQMAKDGLRPDRSIALLAVSGEEKGLLGSEFYSLNPIIPLKNTVCNLNIDMIGRWDAAHEQKADSMYTYVIGADRISKALHRANERVAESTGLRMDYTFDRADDPNRFYYRSDHYNFAKQNVPVIFYFTGVHKDYHRPTDTPDKLMYGKMAGIVRHIFRTAWHLADMPERIRPDK
jgi:Zn-dependent M28 family amino/carboxypeptidase